MTTHRESYFGTPGVNWSTLKYMRDSPMAYRHALANPPADRPAFAIGRAVHTLVFEPQKFDAEYVIWTEGRRAGKAWEEFKAQNAAMTILKPEEYDECADMARAVQAHPLVAPYLVGGVFEQPVYWTDPATGIECKAKPDWVIPERGILLDLKTARSIEARRFGAEAARMGYHMQLAHYAAGCRIGAGFEVQRQLVVAVEKEPPYDVAVFEIGPDEAYVAAQDVAELLAQLRECRDADRWLGRYTEEQALQLPAWVTQEDEESPDGFGLDIGKD
jgi:hypothetical protein